MCLFIAIHHKVVVEKMVIKTPMCWVGVFVAVAYSGWAAYSNWLDASADWLELVGTKVPHAVRMRMGQQKPCQKTLLFFNQDVRFN